MQAKHTQPPSQQFVNTIAMNDYHIAKDTLETRITTAFESIAPCWPLQNLILCNPLKGFEECSFEEALAKGQLYFQEVLPFPEMETINRETIKWCQVFFDQGQAIITMPYRQQGLYQALCKVLPFDQCLTRKDKTTQHWLATLPSSPQDAIATCLTQLGIKEAEQTLFLTLLLTTLPGWASYVKYQTDWLRPNKAVPCQYPVNKADYLAMRLIITCLVWQDAKQLLVWHSQLNTNRSDELQRILRSEGNNEAFLYHALMQKQETKRENEHTPPLVQLVFCMDVRSEPIRRALETQGHYTTWSCAGSFGLPVMIENSQTDELYASCSVLITPKHTIKESVVGVGQERKANRATAILKRIKQVSHALRATFSLPTLCIAALGPLSGLWLLLRLLMPTYTSRLKEQCDTSLGSRLPTQPLLSQKGPNDGMPLDMQCQYASYILRKMGFTTDFARLIILVGHSSQSDNNAYSAAFDCSACGGHDGSHNAAILAMILNKREVREYLATCNIVIPSDTLFIAAKHNTTTDEFRLFRDHNEHPDIKQLLDQVKRDLDRARKATSQWRNAQLDPHASCDDEKTCLRLLERRSHDLAETRPEWGVAHHAAFVVGPRQLTKNSNLLGRVFLHSYDWQRDEAGQFLTAIMTSPLIVAQWINSQYLFSSLDNIAYGSGSTVTHNRVSNIGIMQGNASDLMQGLPMQSLYLTDKIPYHEPSRLLVLIYAPRDMIDKIVSTQLGLQKLLINGWINLRCIEPHDGQYYSLERNLSWQKTNEPATSMSPL